MNCLIPGLFLDLPMPHAFVNSNILQWLVQLLMQFIVGVFSDRVTTFRNAIRALYLN
jgi:hypothetical protein